jgi:hypothetical protein
MLLKFKATTVREFLACQVRSCGWNIFKTAEETNTPHSNI